MIFPDEDDALERTHHLEKYKLTVGSSVVAVELNILNNPPPPQKPPELSVVVVVGDVVLVSVVVSVS